MTDMEDRWLSVDEITRYLGVSSDTVYRWIDKYSMPAHRMGRFWKFKKDEVDAWVKAGGADEGKKRNSDGGNKIQHVFYYRRSVLSRVRPYN